MKSRGEEEFWLCEMVKGGRGTAGLGEIDWLLQCCCFHVLLSTFDAWLFEHFLYFQHLIRHPAYYFHAGNCINSTVRIALR
jgi:hypothetical protein